ncbi:MAG: dTDP-glucose 4,6-dehydratase [Candidatus Pacebacteria bacterium RIFCSPHIGHO2_01_FULL_46_16]|nr:MAG: dTDP-glucose 4,6-dehydratase [Candidatus Pacebacteria bacterium RIFCSPHIGHO2_01_FULL_46_16]OGJ20171.1 MAG: dTDP-glucose 4,6-dehydratase [Candidatus Pacebacteria bacterium RIFCSPHIGHO2_02_FULL_46_9]OGJ37755.1 MAG: dTDP-glucose 4,6-dehydratase [Candidatus Pacebacteria bacterium RIFCSPLOWO2_01_FULL_47_12]
MTLLVTGGAGFIGSNFIQYWHQQYPEDTIRNLDALTYAGTLENLREVESAPQYTFIHGSICDKELVDSAMEGVGLVVHFAAESHVDRSIRNPQIFLETNVIGTQVLLDAAVKHTVRRFHHISTDEVFGTLELGGSEKFSETTPYSPRSPYAASKAGSDHLVRAYGETYGLPYSISNCSNNYGPRQFPEKLIALTITNCIDGKPVPVYGDGKQVRDWLYVLDHCTAIEQIILSDHCNTTFLVGGETKETSNLEIITQILSEMNIPETVLEYIVDRPGHDRKYSVDWSHIYNTLGWQPSVTLKEGLAKTIAWYRANEAWWRPLKEQNKAYFQAQYHNTN